MNAQKSGRLDDESRRLLGKMVQNRIGSLSAAAKPEAPQPAPPPSTGATDFQNLPGYKELKLQRSMAALAGLDNPYFRLHEAAAGATTIIGGRKFTNFSSYEYLGLNQHPEVAGRRTRHSNSTAHRPRRAVSLRASVPCTARSSRLLQSTTARRIAPSL